jgi:methionine synthase reductase
VDPWIEKLWELLPNVLLQDEAAAVENSKVEEALEKQVSELKVDPADIPYSMDNRIERLPEPVEKYLHLENSLVEQDQLKQQEVPKVTSADIPYSMDNRIETLPEPVDKYLHLENSLVENGNSNGNGNGNVKTQHKGHPLKISLTGLEPGAKLTGLPRASTAVAKLVELEDQSNALTGTHSGDEKKVPEFVVTPAPLVYAPITMISCLTADDAVKRTLELELDIGDETNFEPGDAFGVVAPNDEGLVEAVLTRLNIPKERYNVLYKLEGGDNLPTHLNKASSVSIADLFRYGVDLTGAPRKALFRVLADFTTDPKEKLTLMYVCSKQGIAAFNALREESPTLLDILETFPSCHPPVDRLLDMLPAHMPRFYSISSSPLKRHGKIRFAFNIVEYTTVSQIERKGVATPWLDQLSGLVPSRKTPTNTHAIPGVEIKVPIFIRQNANAFVLPNETQRPLVLVGPGTGIAPFIGFLEHRQTQRQIRMTMGAIGHNPTRQIRDQFGPIHVYYGFRNKNKDFLFETELREFQKDGTITKLRLAESRSSDGAPKEYVQDQLRQDADEIYDLVINQDAAIYICGDAKGMAKGVQDALVDMLVERQKDLDAVEANKLLMKWIAEKKYLRDLVSFLL